jgi:toxin CptA
VTTHIERPPLLLRPGLSRCLAAFIAMTHAAALAVALGIPVAWYWRLALALAILMSLAHAAWVHLFHRAPWAVREALWAADGTWTLTLASGREIDATLGPSTFASTWLVVLNFRCGRLRRCALVLLPDNLDPTLLRRLRVRLRLTGGGDPTPQTPA